MNDLRNEDQRLAAFLDARLDAARRAEMLAHLAANHDDYEVFARVASILRQLEAEAASLASPDEKASASAHGSKHEGLTPLLIRRPSARRWVALAAMLAGVALAHGSAVEPHSSYAVQPILPSARSELTDDPWGSRYPAWASVR